MKKNLIAMLIASIAVLAAPNAASAKLAAPLATASHSAKPVFPWIIIGCAGGVVLTALVANYRFYRELTANEAASCGLLFLFTPPN